MQTLETATDITRGNIWPEPTGLDRGGSGADSAAVREQLTLSRGHAPLDMGSLVTFDVLGAKPITTSEAGRVAMSWLEPAAA